MKPEFFKGHNIVLGKDQPEYLPLPAMVDKDGNMLTEWSFDEAERAAIARGEHLKISVMTFNKPFQPTQPYLASIDYPKEHLQRRERLEKMQIHKMTAEELIDVNTTANGMIQIENAKRAILLDRVQHLDPEERLYFLWTNTAPERKKESYPVESEVTPDNETVKCECGKDEPLKYATMDDDGNWSCHECFKEHILTHHGEFQNSLVERIEKLKEKLTTIKDDQVEDRIEAKIEAFNEVLDLYNHEES